MQSRSVSLCLASFLSFGAAAAHAQFVEPGVEVIARLADPDGVPGLFGWAVADMADINGDGVTEVITSSPAYGTAEAPSSGRVYVFSGRDGALLHMWTGDAFSQLGYSIADAGDVDEDGANDVIAGANGQGGTGAATIFSGATGAVIRVHAGEAPNDNFGSAVTGLGDIDGDGASDYAVGAITHDTGALNAGRVYVYSGATGSPIRTHDGARQGGLLGSGVANSGDVNKDGVNDYIAGAHGGPPTDPGRAFVFSGADGSLILPELNADPATGLDFGSFFVAGAGDVNGDGTLDLYVGDYSDNAGRGAAYVFSGIDGAEIRRFLGPTPSSGLGCGRGARDINADGCADLIAGMYSDSQGANNAGGALVFSGKDGAVLRSLTSTTAFEQFGYDAVGVGDVNADCALDYVVGAASGEAVYIIAGDFPTLKGDADNSGNVNFYDVVSVLHHWGNDYSPTTGEGDADRDGEVDFHDVLAVLKHWGDRCQG